MIGIFIALLTGLLTWFLSWVYIKILFFPKTSFYIGQYKWESPLHHIIKNLPFDDLIAQYKSNAFSVVLPFIDSQLDVFFKERLVQKMPVISMFIGDKTIAQLKEVFLEELHQLFPDLISGLAAPIQRDLMSSLSAKWAPILEVVLMNATKKLRWLSFLVGSIWGAIIYLFLMQL